MTVRKWSRRRLFKGNRCVLVAVEGYDGVGLSGWRPQRALLLLLQRRSRPRLNSVAWPVLHSAVSPSHQRRLLVQRTAAEHCFVVAAPSGSSSLLVLVDAQPTQSLPRLSSAALRVIRRMAAAASLLPRCQQDCLVHYGSSSCCS